MMIDKPTYVVAELPDELATWVKSIRQRFEPAIVHMPQEITLAGSSGVGPIAIGQRVDKVSAELQQAVAGETGFSFRFLCITSDARG